MKTKILKVHQGKNKAAMADQLKVISSSSKIRFIDSSSISTGRVHNVTQKIGPENTVINTSYVFY